MTLTEHYERALEEVEFMIQNASYYDDIEELEKERAELKEKLERFKEYSAWTVCITEKLSRNVVVRAKTKEEALQVAKKHYYNAESGYVLTADDFKVAYFEVEDKEG